MVRRASLVDCLNFLRSRSDRAGGSLTVRKNLLEL